MTQEERRIYLIQALLREQPRYAGLEIPGSQEARKRLLRALLNVRPAMPASETFLAVQDAYLQEAIRQKGITALEDLTEGEEDLYLWRGDITTLRCDAIVNAANSGLLGCFCPNHGCIDNAIHTYAGVQLRLACWKIMEAQGHEEAPGQAKITPAFNLPSTYVLHTVGPIVGQRLTDKDCALLESCYRSCLTLAEARGAKSLALCCVSTGEFHFPNQKAAEIAVQTVKAYKRETNSSIKVIFNVFRETDEAIYRAFLRGN